MLEEMRIRGLGVIGEAVLELGPGLTVVTGETGAGKTMVVTGLGLLLGARADAGAVRTGAPSALVEGLLRIDPDGPVAERAREAGAVLDDDTLLVARTVSSEGRSRAHLGGRSVPVGLLAELAPELVAVHGQADQIRLQTPARQRELLDRYAGEPVTGPLEAYAECFEQVRELQARLDDVRTRGRERRAEADQLRHGLAEIEAVDPQPGEDTTLATELSRLTHSDALREAAELAHAALAGASGDADPMSEAPNAAALLAAAGRSLESAAALDPALGELASRLAEVGFLTTDVATELASYATGVDADPTRMAVVQERVAALRGLTRRYADGGAVDAVLAWGASAAVRLAELDDDGSLRERLELELAGLRVRLAELATQVSVGRTAAADRLGGLVGAELAELAMPHARLEAAVAQRMVERASNGTGRGDQANHAGDTGDTGDTETIAGGLELADGRRVAFGRHGIDEVELLLSPHDGAPARPLSRGASGGELSRVMLALEVVLAGVDPVPTFVFDEVDAGVGGRAAVEIGRRLARLAEVAQVLVVTHLPQVAAYADRHLVVTKAADGSVVESGVVALDHAGRVQELARMLAGQEESRAAQAHAKELLASARSEAR